MNLDIIRKKVFVRREIEDFFLEEGFLEINPMIFQDYMEFSKINRGLPDKEIIKLVDSNGAIKVLRPDITTVIKKPMVKISREDKIHKFYYSSNIYRNDNKFGAIEIPQIGGEILFKKDIETQCKIIEMVITICKKYNGKFILEVGNVGFLEELLKDLETSMRNKIYYYLEKKNFDELKDYMYQNRNMDLFDTIFKISKFQGEVGELNDLYALGSNEKLNDYITWTKEIYSYLKEKGLEGYVHIDLTMVTSLDYYCGLIFSGYYYGELGEVVNGGQYMIDKDDAIGFTVYMNKIYRSIKGSDKYGSY